jgi:hypothetical protein
VGPRNSIRLQIHRFAASAEFLHPTGARLFEGIGPDLELEQIRLVEAPGVAHLKYRVVK